MKLLIRLVLTRVLLGVIAAGGLLAYLFLAFPAAGPAPDVSIKATPERVARGEYLAHHVSRCIDCHAERGPEHPASERRSKPLAPSARIAG
jgi:mono/diheme cytochrome c family protein